MNRARVAILMLACLAAPAWPQTTLRVYGPVDLAIDAGAAGIKIDSGLHSDAWLRMPRKLDDLDPGTRDGLIGLTVPLGGGAFSAGYLHKVDHFQGDVRARKVALGYYHRLSKDSTFYVVGSRLRSGVTVRYQTVLPGRPRQLISIGIRRQF